MDEAWWQSELRFRVLGGRPAVLQREFESVVAARLGASQYSQVAATISSRRKAWADYLRANLPNEPVREQLTRGVKSLTLSPSQCACLWTHVRGGYVQADGIPTMSELPEGIRVATSDNDAAKEVAGQSASEWLTSVLVEPTAEASTAIATLTAYNLRGPDKLISHHDLAACLDVEPHDLVKVMRRLAEEDSSFGELDALGSFSERIDTTRQDGQRGVTEKRHYLLDETRAITVTLESRSKRRHALRQEIVAVYLAIKNAPGSAMAQAAELHSMMSMMMQQQSATTRALESLAESQRSLMSVVAGQLAPRQASANPTPSPRQLPLRHVAAKTSAQPEVWIRLSSNRKGVCCESGKEFPKGSLIDWNKQTRKTRLVGKAA